jgi:2-keto-4-pentenoate hydratase/2-oxohepta-3-ene-1,7-dioic acid hydratase in catechol pathway
MRMKFATFVRDGQVRVGLLLSEGVLDLYAAKQAEGIPGLLPDTLQELIIHQEEALPVVKAIKDAAASGQYILPLAAVSLLAPIPRPRKNIFCVGKNYRDHVKELKSEELPKYPVFFTKAPTAVIGPEMAIDSHPEVTRYLDYEGELSVVIGAEAKAVKKEQVLDYIFGYTILNDVSARDRQKRHGQWFMGKSLDTFAPMGPVLVHKDELPDPHNLKIETRVNGEVRQSANTAMMIFDIPALIETLCAGITLEPGDIIATGTPAGVGLGFDPPRFLQPGDVVEVEIEGIGVLRNTVK